MKRFAIVLVAMFGLVSLAWGGPPTVKVEVTNDPLYVDILAQPQSYEYVVLRVENQNAQAAVNEFQAALNTFTSEGWEFVSFAYSGYTSDSPSYEYHAIMRIPKE